MRAQRNVTSGPSRTRSPVWLLVTAGTSLALLLTGCGEITPVIDLSAESDTASAPSSTGPADAVRWMDGLCGAVDGFLADNNAMQTPANDPENGQKELSTMLGYYAAILDTAIDRLADLPPVADPIGQAAQQTFVGNYTSARDVVTTAKTQLDAAAPDDFDAQMRAGQAFTVAQQTALSSISAEQAIMTSPELSTALTSAHQCASTS